MKEAQKLQRQLEVEQRQREADEKRAERMRQQKEKKKAAQSKKRRAEEPAVNPLQKLVCSDASRKRRVAESQAPRLGPKLGSNSSSSTSVVSDKDDLSVKETRKELPVPVGRSRRHNRVIHMPHRFRS